VTVALALDVGGTKLAAGLVSSDGTVVRSARVATPVTVDAGVVWGACAALLDRVLDESGAAAYDVVGIGCGGPMRWPEGVVSPGNMTVWREFPLLDLVRERYAGARPAVLHNDAVALAVGEHRWGAGRGSDHLMGVTVSTGVGAGLVLGGRRVDGETGNAGHLGHVVVDPHGPPCSCGGRGCTEAVARGPAIAAYAVELGWTGAATGLAVAEGARAGDVACSTAFTRAGRALGVAIASAAALLDLDVVVVGGGISQAGEVFWAPLRAAFDEHAGWEFVRRCRIVPAGLGDEAALIGAAALAL
jgi:glucokinase